MPVCGSAPGLPMISVAPGCVPSPPTVDFLSAAMSAPAARPRAYSWTFVVLAFTSCSSVADVSAPAFAIRTISAGLYVSLPPPDRTTSCLPSCKVTVAPVYDAEFAFAARIAFSTSGRSCRSVVTEPAAHVSSVASTAASAPIFTLIFLPDRPSSCACVSAVRSPLTVPDAAGRVVAVAPAPAVTRISDDPSLTTLTAWRGSAVSMMRLRYVSRAIGFALPVGPSYRVTRRLKRFAAFVSDVSTW